MVTYRPIVVLRTRRTMLYLCNLRPHFCLHWPPALHLFAARALKCLARCNPQWTKCANTPPYVIRVVEESVEDMMARYRLQSAILRVRTAVCIPRNAPSVSGRSVQPLRSHTGPHTQWLRSIRRQVKRGLKMIFSNSFIGPIAGHLIDEIAASTLPLSTAPSKERISDTTVEDNFLILMLKAFLSEAITLQQTGLTSIICETERLLRLLMNSVAVGLSSIGGDVPRNPIASDLIRHLCKERTYRRPYFNYILKSAERTSEFKRYLSILNLRLQRDLLLQCDFILHKAVTTFLDSQLDTFQQFYAKVIQERANTEMVDTSDPAPTLVAHFVDKLLRRWSALSSDDLLLVPLDDPDFEYLSETSTILAARLHIERMVMEKLYRSGIWMNDVRVERERDSVLHRELGNLNASVTMSDLQIPEHYHVLEPFQSAQDELRKLDRSHVPAEIVQCLRRVVECIVATLTLITPNSAPSADELLPVLIYVIIQVNPPRLLTNLAFIEVFGGVFDGEDQYIWCQFRAAVTEVRRMLSLLPSDQECRTSKATYHKG
ncbi:uncharacterized protein DEA37_0009078 [Paragonimus westermani]|uniref:VPS9 domain-containing protein n=1 Tax=Paragonimus westermani TaxID=34504 RepID=A0A5J4NHJ2_9TREM|nr:uncharacterized protein DEA37_0009078 [Paragonimus westermani]